MNPQQDNQQNQQDSQNQSTDTSVSSAPNNGLPQQPTPQGVFNNQPNQFTPTGLPTPPALPKKGKKGLIVGLIVLVVAIIIGLVVFMMVLSKDKASSPVAQNNQTDNQNTAGSTATTTGLKTTTYSTSAEQNPNVVKVSVEHPSSWKVEQGPDERAEEQGQSFVTAGKLTITSARGNKLYLSDASRGGYGGSCDEEVDVVLVKRIPIKTDGFVFEEFRGTVGDSELKQGLVFRPILESVAGGVAPEQVDRFNSLKEGDRFVGDCRAVNSYPSIQGNDRLNAPVIFVRLAETGETINYDQIKDDTEFIAMLKSLQVLNR